MPVDPADITPDLAAVGARIRNRTLSPRGVVLGTFTADTIPTAEQAEKEIASAARFVALRLGRPGATWDGDFLASARDAVEARAALKIELGYYADGSRVDSSIVDQLGRVAREELDAVMSTARDNQIGGSRLASVRIVSARGRRRTGP